MYTPFFFIYHNYGVSHLGYLKYFLSNVSSLRLLLTHQLSRSFIIGQCSNLGSLCSSCQCTVSNNINQVLYILSLLSWRKVIKQHKFGSLLLKVIGTSTTRSVLGHLGLTVNCKDESRQACGVTLRKAIVDSEGR